MAKKAAAISRAKRAVKRNRSSLGKTAAELNLKNLLARTSPWEGHIVDDIGEGFAWTTPIEGPAKGTNPKDLLGKRKIAMGNVSMVAAAYEAEAMADGIRKYGRTNWRENNVIASIYVDACLRHIGAWFDSREEHAEDSGAPHLGHAKACLSIIIDALEGGNLVDDRPKIAGPFQAYLKKREKKV